MRFLRSLKNKASLSGPVGVYSIVGEAAHTSVESVLYLMAYLFVLFLP